MQKRPYRNRRCTASKRRRAPAFARARNLGSFGFALAHLHANDRDPERVLLELTAGPSGNTEADRVFVRDALHVATHGCVTTGEVGDRKLREPTHKTARGILRLLVNRVARMVRAPGGIKIPSSRAAFWGKQTVDLPPPKRQLSVFEEVNEEFEQLERETVREIYGVVPKRVRPRRYVPMHQASGVASQLGASVSTVGRHARLLRAQGLLCSSRVRAGAPEATMPRNGRYPYPQWLLLREPPPGLLYALRVLWGEVTPEAKQRRPLGARPSQAPRPVPSAAGPPSSRPLDPSMAAKAAEFLARFG